MPEEDLTADVFDELYALARSSTVLRDTFRAGFPDLPDWLDTFSFVPASGLAAIAAAIRIDRGGTILDVGCGLGGPGILVAEQRPTEHLIGVDWSATALAGARSAAAARGASASYAVASGADLPLRDGCVDAAICIDVLPFLPGFGLVELRRVLRSRARLVITAWERDEPVATAPAVPDFARLLSGHGFAVLEASERPDWLEMQRAVYLEAVRRVAAGEADQVVASLAEEANATLSTMHRDRRVVVVAERP